MSDRFGLILINSNDKPIESGGSAGGNIEKLGAALTPIPCTGQLTDVLMESMRPATFVFVAGKASGDKLTEDCTRLSHAGFVPIVVRDALVNCEPVTGISGASTAAGYSHNFLHETLLDMERKGRYQVISTRAALELIRRRGLFVYSHALSSSTATVVLLFEEAKYTLVVRRGNDPFKDCWAFPGGFQEVGEKLSLTAVRELHEETGILLEEEMLVQVDTRSDPNRDPRGQVNDHGFAQIVPDSLKMGYLNSMKAADDAVEVKIVPVAELLAGEMAFDHQELLSNALRWYQETAMKRRATVVAGTVKSIRSQLQSRIDAARAWLRSRI